MLSVVQHFPFGWETYALILITFNWKEGFRGETKEENMIV